MWTVGPEGNDYPPIGESCEQFHAHNGTALQPTLAVLATRPTHVPFATREDFINPSCCLNSTICGLISRTVHNTSLIGPNDFHGVRVYKEFAAKDQTARYLDGVPMVCPAAQ